MDKINEQADTGVSQVLGDSDWGSETELEGEVKYYIPELDVTTPRLNK